MGKLVQSFKEARAYGLKPRQLESFSFGGLEECKSLLFEAMQLFDQTTKLQWLPEYDRVSEWMVNTKGKGLLLTGDCGRGKSIILTGAIPLLFQHMYNKILRPFHINDLEEKHKLREIMNYWSYCIDEVGSEPILSDFGAKYYPFTKLMDKAENQTKLCFISTNLLSEEIEAKYGTRVLDRFDKHCFTVKFSGMSFR